MGRWTASWRLHFEKGLRKEPDGSFIVRPFGVFGRSYALPDDATKDRYITKRIRFKFTFQIIFSVFLFIIFLTVFFSKSVLILISPTISLILVFMFPMQILLESTFAWRMLRVMGGHPVLRAR